MLRIMPPALAYALPVFAAGFVLGALRAIWVAPALGPLAAVALELPVMLGIAWGLAGPVFRRWPGAPRAATGATAFAILMALEAALEAAFGQSTAAFLAGLTTPAGALGLTGQIGFGLIPRLRLQTRG